MKYTVIVNVDLEYTIEADSPKEAEAKAKDVKIPSEFLADGLQVVGIERQED